VLAQRLVRVICENCRKQGGLRLTPRGEEVMTYRGAGCDRCFNTGYVGRMGIFELMELREDLRRLIMQKADAGQLTLNARSNGMRNLREDGWEKVERGITTPEEVMRVTQDF